MSTTKKYDAIVIGGGHNGLVNGAYLAKSGLNTLILERRHLVGGAAITEELRPGFNFTTFSYALSLIRPDIIQTHLVWENDGKIYYREFHVEDSLWGTITMLDSGGCSNPVISADKGHQKFALAYQKSINGTDQIYLIENDSCLL